MGLVHIRNIQHANILRYLVNEGVFGMGQTFWLSTQSLAKVRAGTLGHADEVRLTTEAIPVGSGVA